MNDASPYRAAMAPAPITADEVLRLSIPNKRVELVRGTLAVREPTRARHGRVTVRLTAPLSDFVQANGLGQVYAAETGFKLATQPDTVRAPDIAFVSRARLPDPEPVGYAPLAPDLVVEVVPDRPAGRSTRQGRRLAQRRDSAGMGRGPRAPAGPCLPPRRRRDPGQRGRGVERRGRGAGVLRAARRDPVGCAGGGRGETGDVLGINDRASPA